MPTLPPFYLNKHQQKQTMSEQRQSFKERRTYSERCKDVEAVRSAHQNKIPVIIERHHREKALPMMDKSKFLIPDHLNMSDVTKIIRRRLHLSPSQTLYLLVQNRSMVSCSTPLAEVYEKDKDGDGFLYVVYVAQESFGCGTKSATMTTTTTTMMKTMMKTTMTTTTTTGVLGLMNSNNDKTSMMMRKTTMKMSTGVAEQQQQQQQKRE